MGGGVLQKTWQLTEPFRIRAIFYIGSGAIRIAPSFNQHWPYQRPKGWKVRSCTWALAGIASRSAYDVTQRLLGTLISACSIGRRQPGLLFCEPESLGSVQTAESSSCKAEKREARVCASIRPP